MKLLLVDDEEEFVFALAERLELRGLAPLVVLDGEQALRTIEREAIDTVLLDLKMPGIGGLEVLRRVKQKHPHVKVVMLTGHGSEKDEEEALRCGAFAYLRKPARIEEIVAVLRETSGDAQGLPGSSPRPAGT
jgi:DNA-binding response OmpR family regulator